MIAPRKKKVLTTYDYDLLLVDSSCVFCVFSLRRLCGVRGVRGFLRALAAASSAKIEVILFTNEKRRQRDPERRQTAAKSRAAKNEECFLSRKYFAHVAQL